MQLERESAAMLQEVAALIQKASIDIEPVRASRESEARFMIRDFSGQFVHHGIRNIGRV